ncbi:hypothetical protein A6F55_23850 [Prescottella equi]|uniref:hypothetical protein n=1 Tax=Rhodococcus hoagii TaxID=43767 RepID=UPI000A118A41|nr:hypothetical protein [Prescottella equi]ORJ92600.1 hypothetical protein A6F55_23850 [Prescottella equi]
MTIPDIETPAGSDWYTEAVAEHLDQLENQPRWDLAAELGRRFAACPPKPRGCRVVYALPNGRIRERGRARLVYAGEREGIHYWAPVTPFWIQPDDRMQVDEMPPNTVIQGIELAA